MLKPIIVSPTNSKCIILWGDDENKEHTLEKGLNCQGSVIKFDKFHRKTINVA